MKSNKAMLISWLTLCLFMIITVYALWFTILINELILNELILNESEQMRAVMAKRESNLGSIKINGDNIVIRLKISPEMLDFLQRQLEGITKEGENDDVPPPPVL